MEAFEELALELPDLAATVAVRALDRWLARQGLTLEELRRPSRDPLSVEARRRAAKFLRGRGWSYPQIGAHLERDHTSIMHLLNPRRRLA